MFHHSSSCFCRVERLYGIAGVATAADAVGVEVGAVGIWAEVEVDDCLACPRAVDGDVALHAGRVGSGAVGCQATTGVERWGQLGLVAATRGNDQRGYDNKGGKGYRGKGFNNC